MTLPLAQRFVCFAMVLSSMWIGLAVTVHGRSASPDGTSHRVLILIIDRLAVEDFVQFPTATMALTRLANTGDVGLMNVRTAGMNDSKNGYLSLATGMRAQAGPDAGKAFMVDERIGGATAGQIYHGLTGTTSSTGIVHIGIGQLLRNTAGVRAIGIIGQSLADRGMNVAVIGNGDTARDHVRLAALLGIDRGGVILRGDVGAETTVRDPTFPGNVRTDYESVFTLLDDLDSVADLIIVDVSDLARIEQNIDTVTPDYELAIRRQSLERVSSFVDRILAHPTLSRRIVLVLSPSPSIAFGRNGIGMTPVIQWHPHRRRTAKTSGLLASPSTRRPGIVTNTDFLPTLLRQLGVGEEFTDGRGWGTYPREQSLPRIIAVYEKIKSVHLQRLPVIQPYFFGVLILFVLSGITYGLWRLEPHIAMSVTRRLHSSFVRRLWQFVLTAFLAFPVVLLLSAPFPVGDLSQTAFIIVALTITLASLAQWIEKTSGLSAIGTIGLFTAASLVVDILLDAPMMKQSLLGYDPVAGSRFYGIGNEYMGVLIGSALVGVGFMSDRLATDGKFILTPSYTLFVLASLFLHPRLGINVGGSIAALFAAGAAYAFAREIAITWKNTIIWTAVAAAIIGIVALIDSHVFTDQTSHLGQTIHHLGSGGNGTLWSLFGRKIAVNIKLIRLTIWSRVVFFALAFLGFVLFYPNRLASHMKQHERTLLVACQAGFIGAIAALVANDSGVVAAATLLVWPSLTLLSLGLRHGLKKP